MAKFHPQKFLATVGHGKTLLTYSKKRILFSQGNAADAVFYLEEGAGEAVGVSKTARKPCSRSWNRGTLLGKGVSPASWCAWPRRPPSGTSLLVRIEKQAMIEALHKDSTFCRAVSDPSFVSQHSHPRRLGGSAVQFQREAAGADPSVNGPFRERRAGGGRSFRRSVRKCSPK